MTKKGIQLQLDNLKQVIITGKKVIYVNEIKLIYNCVLNKMIQLKFLEQHVKI